MLLVTVSGPSPYFRLDTEAPLQVHNWLGTKYFQDDSFFLSDSVEVTSSKSCKSACDIAEVNLGAKEYATTYLPSFTDVSKRLFSHANFWGPYFNDSHVVLVLQRFQDSQIPIWKDGGRNHKLCSHQI